MKRLRSLLLTVAALAAAATVLLLVAAAPAASAGQGPRAGTAIAAVIGDRPASRHAVPADFGTVMGYRPVLRQGRLVDPLGECSTVLPLPAEFEPACLEHDLGYDLLRYGRRIGEPLGGAARLAADARMVDRFRTACAERRHDPTARFGCFLTAEVAATGVRLNTVRQRFGSPDETPQSAAVTIAAGTSAASMLTVLLMPGIRRRRLAASVRPPAAGGTLLTAAAVLLSLVPSMLPRPAPVQGVFTGLLLLVAFGVHRLAGRLNGGRVGSAGEAVRWSLVTVAALLVLVGTTVSGRSADAYRHDLGRPDAGPAYWWTVAGVAVLVVAAAAGARALLRASRHRLRRRGTRWACLATVVVVAATGPAAADAGWRLLESARDVRLVLTDQSPVPGSVRAYVRLDEAPTAERRAALAVRRLASRDGFDKSALVVAFPTGTGWVNPFAVRGVERALDGDVATVAVQAGRAPSWAEMFFRRGEQQASARALYRAVLARVGAMPASERPAVYLYGESLGALVGQALARNTHVRTSGVCGFMWAGVPGGGQLGLAAESLHRNPDDPVVHWEPRLVWDRPDDWPLAWWIPGVTYLATTLDLVTSLDAPHGHGHRYGPEQDWGPPPCGGGGSVRTPDGPARAAG